MFPTHYTSVTAQGMLSVHGIYIKVCVQEAWGPKHPSMDPQ